MVEVKSVEQPVGDGLLREEVAVARDVIVVRQRVEPRTRTALYGVLVSARE